MLQFYRDLYLDSEIKHPEVIKWRLQHNAGSLSLYVITLCDTDPISGETLCDGQLQFFHSAFLQQSYIKENCPMIIGLARGREGAMDLICRIVQECLDTQHNAELVPFLARRDTRIETPGETPVADLMLAGAQKSKTKHMPEDVSVDQTDMNAPEWKKGDT